MRRVFVYIDGYNLYYSMRNNGLYEFLWLDIEKLIATYLSPTIHEIACIKFFSSIWRKKPDSAKRHENFMKALKAVSGEKFKIVRGKFEESEDHICPSCGKVFRVQREKWTDVNIAVQMLDDALNNRYDICVLVSSDTDFKPALELVKKYDKEVRILFPPEMFNPDLASLSEHPDVINKQQIIRCQLPPTVISPNGERYVKPLEWMAGVPDVEL